MDEAEEEEGKRQRFRKSEWMRRFFEVKRVALGSLKDYGISKKIFATPTEQHSTDGKLEGETLAHQPKC